MHFLALDLDTGGLAPHPLRTAHERRRAEWMRDTIGLNKRALPRARKRALSAFRAMLKEYADDRDGGADAATLALRKADILGMNHRTVLREMWRQRALHPTLDPIFQRLPEVGTWW
ncbi:MAG: hypothetical protein ACI8PZ_002990 [Myxococcota bacterium]|jgi:hypothetical protein